MTKSQAGSIRQEPEPPLQPTPVNLTSHATLMTLKDLQDRNLPFPCYPTLESESPDKRPESNDRIRQLWECSEEAVILKGVDRSSKKPATTTSRASYDFTFYTLKPEPTPAAPAQDEEDTSPTLNGEYKRRTPSPSPHSPTLAISTVPAADRRMRRDFLGWAPRSLRNRRAEARDREMTGRAEREESVSQIHRSAPCVTKRDHSDVDDE
ncbi:uncharacterized protein EKO05_0001649 [Ascochyta rabiei]|uniref:Uncharacterized protein n=1 Tax=Didymella rabiei TaxID=5454 RepID=A0A163BEL5_DIDRA|nr:uncharacterized protein EKO05_0001649 [Ascochyta rabiei]KZM21732.1 hypothetical protein ST47_g7052 [Ascochyta rabiei]UPX11022.1 hypothetical protein EKO05_0001649 [Ascochyta rabiei]